MHKAAAAEWILSLVTTRENAAATVGDLVETSSLSPFTVLRIAASGVLQQVKESPGKVALFAVLAFVGQFVAYSPLAVGFAWLLGGWSPLEHGWIFPMFAATFLVTQIFVGKWIIRLCPGREMSVCIGLVILNALAGIKLNNVSISMSLWWQIPMLIGAVSERRLMLRRA
jgi:hypothetical protein